MTKGQLTNIATRTFGALVIAGTLPACTSIPHDGSFNTRYGIPTNQPEFAHPITTEEESTLTLAKEENTTNELSSIQDGIEKQRGAKYTNTDDFTVFTHDPKKVFCLVTGNKDTAGIDIAIKNQNTKQFIASIQNIPPAPNGDYEGVGLGIAPVFGGIAKVTVADKKCQIDAWDTKETHIYQEETPVFNGSWTGWAWTNISPDKNAFEAPKNIAPN